jgi:hypothetical protein
MGIKIMTPLLFGLAVFLMVDAHYMWAGVLILLGLVILTTYYVTEINMAEKRYHDYVSILGVKVNHESNSFSKIDRIFITKGNYSQKVNTRVQSRQMDWSDYTATVLFDEDQTLDLLTRNDKRELLKELKGMIVGLPVEVEDRCGRENYFIDMQRVE